MVKTEVLSVESSYLRAGTVVAFRGIARREQCVLPVQWRTQISYTTPGGNPSTVHLFTAALHDP